GGRRSPEAKTVVVLRGEHDIARPELLRGPDPFVGVEVARVEERGREGAVAPLLPGEGVDAEVEEDAEAVTLPGELLGGRGEGRGGGIGCRRRRRRRRGGCLWGHGNSPPKIGSSGN